MGGAALTPAQVVLWFPPGKDPAVDSLGRVVVLALLFPSGRSSLHPPAVREDAVSVSSPALVASCPVAVLTGVW